MMNEVLSRFSMRKRIMLLSGLIAVVLSTTLAVTTTNSITMPITTADEQSFTVTADTLKPEQCTSITLANIQSGTVTVTGTSANDLLLAENTTATLIGGDGNDCLVAPAGDAVQHNTLDGGPGIDICVGGTDTVMLNCEQEVRI